MARPGRPTRGRPSPPSPHPTPPTAANPLDPEADSAWFGERLRRIALGLTAALLTTRAYWPSESTSELDSSTGLGWVIAVLLVSALAITGWATAGRMRLRWSWLDLGVYLLMALVALSPSVAADKRIAINLAWNWVAIACLYFLLRVLPRTRGESSALAGALVATAVAVSVYGFFQVGVEIPAQQAAYRRDPAPMLREAGIDPADTTSPALAQFESRFLGSNEPFSTFALPNSLAGFLTGCLVLGSAVALEGLRRRHTNQPVSPLAYALAAVPGAILLVCLLLTKSRSAQLGAIGALFVSGLMLQRAIERKTLARIALGAATVVALLIALLLATGRLDRQVFTESSKSLGYRWQYWQGTWSILTDGSTWQTGLGPGNFRGPYLRHKLVDASEAIADPHNLLLEVWSTAGLFAALVLVAVLALGILSLLRAPSDDPPPDPAAPPPEPDPAPAPPRSGWLVSYAGWGGWILVVLLGHLNLFRADDDLVRWLILGAGWLLAVVFGAGLWRQIGATPLACGAAALAVSINLLAAGGIGYPAVSAPLWAYLALGQNLNTSSRVSRFRIDTGRAFAMIPAALLAAIVGTFAGTVGPYWRAEAIMTEAANELGQGPPTEQSLQRAVDRIEEATRADAYSTRPWLALAELEYQAWLARRTPSGDQVWLRIEDALRLARRKPRDEYSLEIQRTRARYASQILQVLQTQDNIPTLARRQLNDIRVDALGKAALRLDPTNAPLRAELADALAAAGDFKQAATAAEQALSLDSQTPHLDKKLPPTTRTHLQSALPYWSAGNAEGSAAPSQAKP